MSTHAEEVARLKDAVVEADRNMRGIEIAAGEDLDEYDRRGGPDARIVWCERVDALIAAEALTCETCGGRGLLLTATGDCEFRWDECPACHGTGRKPDKEEANG